MLNSVMRFLGAVLCITSVLTTSVPSEIASGNKNHVVNENGPGSGVQYLHYYMNTLCNRKLILKSEIALKISPWNNNHPPPTQICYMGVENMNPHYQFVITFNDMDLYGRTGGECKRSRLDLFNGQSHNIDQLISGTRGLCGSHTDKKYYETTTTHFLTLRYETNDLPSDDAQYFEAIITPFHAAPCKHGEFKCASDKCILDDLQCDGYNNCGDDSDEKNCSSVGLTVAAIIGIVIGSVAFVAIVAGVIVAIICCGCCSLYQSL